MFSETIPEGVDNVIRIFNNKDGYEKSITFKVRIDEIRSMRNKLLVASKYSEAERHVPIQINGTIGNVIKKVNGINYQINNNNVV